MTPILILEASVEPPSGSNLVDRERKRERREREDPPTGAVEAGLLHRAFEACAELMTWSSPTLSRTGLPLLWDMYEAGLTGDGADAFLIG